MQTIQEGKAGLVRNQKGMTLIELLAVVIVLGIIMAIAVPSVAGVIERSKLQADKGTWYIIKEAGLRYALANNLDQSTTVDVTTLVNEGYLNEAPQPQHSDIKTRGFEQVEITVSGSKYTIEVLDKDGTAFDESDFE